MEKGIERKFRLWCEGNGWMCLKLRPVTNALGFPDRTVLAWGHCVFVELKTEFGDPSPQQLIWVNRLQSCGFSAGVCYGLHEAKQLVLDTVFGSTPSSPLAALACLEYGGAANYQLSL